VEASSLVWHLEAVACLVYDRPVVGRLAYVPVAAAGTVVFVHASADSEVLVVVPLDLPKCFYR
jgi:hypothetical protein